MKIAAGYTLKEIHLAFSEDVKLFFFFFSSWFLTTSFVRFPIIYTINNIVVIIKLAIPLLLTLKDMALYTGEFLSSWFERVGQAP